MGVGGGGGGRKKHIAFGTDPVGATYIFFSILFYFGDLDYILAHKRGSGEPEIQVLITPCNLPQI